MPSISLSKVRSLKTVENAWPGFSKNVWPWLKETTGTSQRCPKHVRFTDEAERMYPNDYDCAGRYVVDLVTGECLGERHISCV